MDGKNRNDEALLARNYMGISVGYRGLKLNTNFHEALGTCLSISPSRNQKNKHYQDANSRPPGRLLLARIPGQQNVATGCNPSHASASGKWGYVGGEPNKISKNCYLLIVSGGPGGSED